MCLRIILPMAILLRLLKQTGKFVKGNVLLLEPKNWTIECEVFHSGVIKD